MAFDWREYLELARFLHAQAGHSISNEAAWRGAVSKAYLAAYGHAYRYACDYLGFIPRSKPEEKSQDHGRLRVHLKSRRYAISRRLVDLRSWRNACDYEDHLPAPTPLPETAVSAIAAADYVFRSLTPPSSP